MARVLTQRQREAVTATIVEVNRRGLNRHVGPRSWHGGYGQVDARAVAAELAAGATGSEGVPAFIEALRLDELALLVARRRAVTRFLKRRPLDEAGNLRSPTAYELSLSKQIAALLERIEQQWARSAASEQVDIGALLARMSTQEDLR